MAWFGTDLGRRALLLIALGVAVACGLQSGVASSLSTTVARLGGGTGAVAACDANGFTFRLALNDANRVSSVNASSIDATCAGGTLKLTLVNGASDVGSGSVTLPSSGFGGAVDVPISPLPPSDGVTAVVAVIEGP